MAVVILVLDEAANIGSLDALNKEHFETYYGIKQLMTQENKFIMQGQRGQKLQYTVKMHDWWRYRSDIEFKLWGMRHSQRATFNMAVQSHLCGSKHSIS